MDLEFHARISRIFDENFEEGWECRRERGAENESSRMREAFSLKESEKTEGWFPRGVKTV